MKEVSGLKFKDPSFRFTAPLRRVSPRQSRSFCFGKRTQNHSRPRAALGSPSSQHRITWLRNSLRSDSPRRIVDSVLGLSHAQSGTKKGDRFIFKPLAGIYLAFPASGVEKIDSCPRVEPPTAKAGNAAGIISHSLSVGWWTFSTSC